MANNYTKKITLARAYSMPRYMQVLKAINDIGPATKKEIVAEVWNIDPDTKPSNWQNGPFTVLKDLSLVYWVRSEGATNWFITDTGKSFLAKCEAEYLAR